MSYYLTEEMAREAVRLAFPSMEAAMDSGLAKRRDGHIVISKQEAYSKQWKTVWEYSLGDPDNWEHPYGQVARSKDEISRRTGLSSREVQQMHPELAWPDDTIYYGNCIGSGIIVSFSGVDAYIDEVFATIIHQLCLGLIQQKLEAQKARSLTMYQH